MPGNAETTVLMQAASPDRQRSAGMGVSDLLHVLVLGAWLIANSAALITFNKHLMAEGRFPFPIPLVMWHACFCFTLASVLYFAAPSLFPSLTHPEKKVLIDRDVILKACLPIACLFSGHLILSNAAYFYSSVAFLQMIKEANVVAVYAFSILFAIECFNGRNALILLCIVGATTLTIEGELHFSLVGLLVQGSAILFEGLKLVLQTMMLSNTGRKFDALTYVLIVTPLCFMSLSGVLGVLKCIGVESKITALPDWEDIHRMWPTMLLNGLVAFSLNVSIALFVKHSSAVAYTLAGIIKDVMIVIAGMVVLGEEVSGMQGCGFLLQIGLISLYSLLRVCPTAFENGVFAGVQALTAKAFGFSKRSGGSAEETP